MASKVLKGFVLFSVLVTFAECEVRTEVDGDSSMRYTDAPPEEKRPHQERTRFARTTKYSIEELQNARFPAKDSRDLDLDPCKAGEFFNYFLSLFYIFVICIYL